MKAKKIKLESLNVESFRTSRSNTAKIKGGMDCTENCKLDTGCHTCFQEYCG